MPYTMRKKKKDFFRNFISIVFLSSFLSVSKPLINAKFVCDWDVDEVSNRKQFGVEVSLSCVKSGLKPQECQL